MIWQFELLQWVVSLIFIILFYNWHTYTIGVWLLVAGMSISNMIGWTERYVYHYRNR